MSQLNKEVSNLSFILEKESFPVIDSYIESSSFSPFELFLIFLSLIIFTVGILGNFLVVLVVIKNSHMRTITNMFIVNLAIGDILVILICLPPTILTDVTHNWYFGRTMCKIIPYIQYISVSISVMTLTSISYERYYAICYPLKFMATKFRAKIMIFIVWVLSILITLPQPIVITMNHDNDTNTFYCMPTWHVIYQNMFDTLIFVILYILPMALIFYTYTRVVKVLWKIDKSIAWDNSTESNKTFLNKSNENSKNVGNISSGNNKQVTFTTASGSSIAKSKMKNQLNARRKAAKMLISVAAMFAICYLPIHVLNIIRFIYPESTFLNQYAHFMYKIAHVLVYINSSVNPLIYNFMSDNFRKEFRRVLFCRSHVKALANGRTDFALRYTSRNPNLQSTSVLTTGSIVSKHPSKKHLDSIEFQVKDENKKFLHEPTII